MVKIPWSISLVVGHPYEVVNYINTLRTIFFEGEMLQLCFLLALFHYKKCCNYFNFVPRILWDFIVLG